MTDNDADGQAGGLQRPYGRLRVDSPAGVLAIVPHLLGFHPSHSLVVLGLGGASGQVTLAFRYDLPEPPDGELAADIAAHACAVLARSAVPAAIVVGYGPAALVAGPAGQAVGLMLEEGVDIRAVLRAEGGRYWSAPGPDPGGGPAEGIAYDPCSHPAAAALDQAGLETFPDRAALARTLQPVPGTARARRQATQRALRRLDQLMTRASQDGGRPGRALADAGRGAVQQAIRRYRAGGRISAPGRLAFLAVVLAELSVRDDAWARMDPEHRAGHARLWTDVVTWAAPELVPAPASLLAFTAWQAGDGALANVAIERALGADPAYSMALLLGAAVQAGLPPSAARLPMSPQEVAESYEPAAERSAAASPAAPSPAVPSHAVPSPGKKRAN